MTHPCTHNGTAPDTSDGIQKGIDWKRGVTTESDQYTCADCGSTYYLNLRDAGPLSPEMLAMAAKRQARVTA